MPKSLRNVFDSKLNYISFYQAHIRVSNNKKNNRDVIAFEIDLETNLMNLYRSIKNGTYKMGDYHEFIVYKPKVRVIKSLLYVDRIVHQWYVEEFIIPFMVPKFIKDSYACIKDRVTHKAVFSLQRYMRIMKRKYGHYYILKCDIKKYFYSINKNILYSILERYISDYKLLNFTKKLIYDDHGLKGIPIGNYTSQYFANIYLNEFDHYVKEVLSIRYYVRYMDDFIILVDSKEKAREIKSMVSKFLLGKLDLELNYKSKYFPNELGVDFCGYRIFETHLLVRKRSKKKISKLIKKANNDYNDGCLDFQYIRMCYNSWKAHASHASSFHLIRKYHDKFIIKDYLDV